MISLTTLEELGKQSLKGDLDSDDLDPRNESHLFFMATTSGGLEEMGVLKDGGVVVRVPGTTQVLRALPTENPDQWQLKAANLPDEETCEAYIRQAQRNYITQTQNARWN